MTTFQKPINNFTRVLATDHVAADGQLVLEAGSGTLLGTLAANQVFRVTVADGTGTVLGIFEATGITTDTLTGVTAVEGYTDANVPSGSSVSVRPTAKTFSGLQTAVNNLETAGAGAALFDHTSTVSSTTTTDANDVLLDDTIAANTLSADNDKLAAEYGGSFAASGTASRRLRVTFAGVVIINAASIVTASATDWTLRVELIRKSSTTARAKATLTYTGGNPVCSVVTDATLTGLDFTTTNHLILNGAASGAGAASGDVSVKLGTVRKLPHA